MEERGSAQIAVLLTLTVAVASAVITIVATVTPWWVTSVVTPLVLALSLWLAIRYGRQAARFVDRLYARYNKESEHEPSRNTANKASISRRALVYSSVIAAISLVIGVLAGAGATHIFGSSSQPSSQGIGIAQASADMPQSCAGNGPVVLAVSGRQNSPAPSLTSMMASAVRTAILTRAAIGVVNVDGQPQLAYANVFPFSGTSFQLGSALNKVSNEVSGMRATSANVNVLDALQVAGQAVRAACNHGGTIYLEDSGLQDISPLDFGVSSLIAAEPSQVVNFLTSEDELPNYLAGITVVLVGIGDTAPPQSPLGINQQKNLLQIWLAIATASGANVDVDSTPRGGPAPLHVPTVTLVPIAQAAEWTPTAKTFTIFTLGTETIAFEPNTALFSDPDAMTAAITKIAEYLVANHAARVELTGTSDHQGSLTQAIALSLQRAMAVKTALVEQGASPDQITTRGVGWQFPGYVYDLGPNGVLLPGPAAHNRSVIVTPLSN